MTFILRREQKVNKKIDEVFSFFEKVENLEIITPPWLSFKIISPKPYIVNINAEFEYTIKILGLKMKWKSLISEYDPPIKFVDIQLKGPYKKWIHTHLFKEYENYVLIIDHVEYELYGSFLSPVINKFFVKKKLNSIFDYRKMIIEKFFE